MNPDKKPDVEQSKKNLITGQEGKTVFTDREIKAIVKDFIAAYISGQIKLVFPDAKCIVEGWKERGEPMTKTKASKLELDVKNIFTNDVAVCSGAKKATFEEQEEALGHLFGTIVSMRNTDRIEGVFAEYSLEARVKRLEEGIDKVNNLVEEIVDWIMRGVVDK